MISTGTTSVHAWLVWTKKTYSDTELLPGHFLSSYRFCWDFVIWEYELELQRRYPVTVPAFLLINLYKQYGDHFHREWSWKDWDFKLVSACHHFCHRHPRLPVWERNLQCSLFACSLGVIHKTYPHSPFTVFLVPMPQTLPSLLHGRLLPARYLIIVFLV